MFKGTILTDKYMRTNVEDVYAVGDCAMVTNRETGEPAWSPMGSTANIAGRVLAADICGKNKEYAGVLGTGVAKLPGGINAGRTGLTETAAKAAGYDVITALSVVDDKAHYYPGAGNFIIKMVADKTTRKFLGLQVLGSGAVDKVTDIAVTAISLGATVDQLENLDFRLRAALLHSDSSLRPCAERSAEQDERSLRDLHAGGVRGRSGRRLPPGRRFPAAVHRGQLPIWI